MSIRSLFIAAAVGGTLIAASPLSAQIEGTLPPPERSTGWEFLLSSGSVVPTGAQRDAIKRGNLSAAQLSYVVHPALAITGTLGWARSRDIASDGDPKLNLFTYDLGAELRAPRMFTSRAVTVRPFAGLGSGARSYDYRGRRANATHNVAAYASAGGEVGFGRIRVRLEARDYVSGFKPLAGTGASDARNDVAVLAGLRIITR